ncbi:hypothetical protein ACTFIY_007408 [Dictyostelium cf. discoideum]
MDNTEYKYIIKILKDKKIIGDNYIEKKKINSIRKLYSISKNDEKTILHKIIKEKKRIVISHDEMNQVFYKNHDQKDHNNKSQFNELLKNYYWETKQMDLDYYLSICKVCHDKYRVVDGKEKTKKRLQQLKSETLNNSSSIVPKQTEKKRKLEEYSDDADSEHDSDSYSDSDESGSDGETKVVIKNKSNNSKLSLSVSTKKKTHSSSSSSSPSKPIQNILPKQPPKKKLELSNNSNNNDEEQSLTVNKKRDNKKVIDL